MRKLGLLSKDTSINFLKYHKLYFVFSILLLIFFISYMAIKGLNLGVDYKGGVVIEVKVLPNISISSIKTDVNNLGISDITFQNFTKDDVIQITVSKTSLQKISSDQIVDKIKISLQGKGNIIKNEYVGPSVSSNLIKSAFLAIFFALLGIFLYVWFRFDWQYGLIAIITLIHDVIIGVGALTIMNYEFNTTTIAAILTIVGYSINDTIITFNQVKENIKRYSREDDLSLLNISLNDVLSRTISTSFTVILVLFSLYLLGGPALTSFSFTLLIGVIFGTYSSICLAVPMLLYVGKFRETNKTKK